MHSYLGPERLRLDTMAGSHSSMESTQIPLHDPLVSTRPPAWPGQLPNLLSLFPPCLHHGLHGLLHRLLQGGCILKGNECSSRGTSLDHTTD